MAMKMKKVKRVKLFVPRKLYEALASVLKVKLDLPKVKVTPVVAPARTNHQLRTWIVTVRK